MTTNHPTGEPLPVPHGANAGTWVQIGIMVVMAIFAAFVWIDARVSSSDSAVSEDVKDIKAHVSRMDDKLTVVCEWKAATDEVIEQLKANNLRCMQHVALDERTWDATTGATSAP